MNDEKDTLVKRFQALGAEGLVDVKFLLRNADEATSGEVYRDVNAMLDAFARNEMSVLDFKDSKRG